MLWLFYALCALSKENPAPFQDSPPSIYSQVITEPTGRNAYEDYAQAADLISLPEFSMYLSWHDGSYKKFMEDYNSRMPEERASRRSQLAVAEQLKGLNFLEVQRALTQHYAPALDLVRAALLKDVWQPRKQMDVETIFPEVANFKGIARLFVADAYVEFADGRSDLGSQDFIDALKFSMHMPSRGPTIQLFVSGAISAISFQGIQANLNCVSYQAWDEIIGLCKTQLADVGIIFRALQSTNVIYDDLLSTAGSSPNLSKFLSDWLPDGAGSIPGQEFVQLGKEARPIVDRYYSEMAQRFAGPEETWSLSSAKALTESDETLSEHPTHSELLRTLVGSLTGSPESLVRLILVSRAQWRVLRLHALIQKYRWERNRLPDRVSDVANSDDLADPLSGKELVYKRLDADHYRVFSPGTAGVGEVELKYKRPLASPETLRVGN